jgi:hypothetical protein
LKRSNDDSGGRLKAEGSLQSSINYAGVARRRLIMLKKDEILNFLKQHKQDIETRFSVKRIGLFGSVLRDSASDKSDVDILVELTNPTFDHYMDLKFFLEDQLGHPVDLVLIDSLKPRLKPIITSEAAYV